MKTKLKHINFARRFREIRIEHGDDFSEFSKRIGVAQKEQVRKWEMGESVPHLKSLIDISNRLGVSLDVFFTDGLAS